MKIWLRDCCFVRSVCYTFAYHRFQLLLQWAEVILLPSSRKFAWFCTTTCVLLTVVWYRVIYFFVAFFTCPSSSNFGEFLSNPPKCDAGALEKLNHSIQAYPPLWVLIDPTCIVIPIENTYLTVSIIFYRYIIQSGKEYIFSDYFNQGYVLQIDVTASLLTMCGEFDWGVHSCSVKTTF
jgi:hypothetical protein